MAKTKKNKKLISKKYKSIKRFSKKSSKNMHVFEGPKQKTP